MKTLLPFSHKCENKFNNAFVKHSDPIVTSSSENLLKQLIRTSIYNTKYLQHLVKIISTQETVTRVFSTDFLYLLPSTGAPANKSDFVKE